MKRFHEHFVLPGDGERMWLRETDANVRAKFRECDAAVCRRSGDISFVFSRGKERYVLRDRISGNCRGEDAVQCRPRFSVLDVWARMEAHLRLKTVWGGVQCRRQRGVGGGYLRRDRDDKRS